MSILSQQHDMDALLERIRRALRIAQSASSTEHYLTSACSAADAGLADCYTYWVCRNEGLEEPYCTVAGYSAADAFVTDAEIKLHSIASITQEDFQS